MRFINLFQALRIRLVIALRLLGVIPMYHWIKLELERKSQGKVFIPKAIPEGTHVLIVCAYYEHPDWVKETIQSVVDQTFDQWTMMIMDDCSPNHALKDVLANLTLDKRIHLLRADENQGAYPCRNQMIAHANELAIPWTHVTFIDPDDVAYEDWLEHCLECIGPGDGVVRVILEQFDQGLNRMKRRVISHSSSMWSRSAWNQLGGLANVRVAGDTELLLRAQYATPEIQFFQGFKPAQRCRMHKRNASKTQLIERKKWLLEREQELKLEQKK